MTRLRAHVFKKLLDTAKPAEFGLPPSSFLSSGPDPSDGVWICCGGHENALVHFTDPHPFKYLKCRFCDHVICPKDGTLKILTPISSIAMEPFQDRFEAQKTAPRYLLSSQQTRYCPVCHSCGLTHRLTIVSARLELRTTPCVCSQQLDKEGLYFFIGSREDYVINPQGRSVQLILDRRFAGLMRTPLKHRQIGAAVTVARRPQTSPSAAHPLPSAVQRPQRPPCVTTTGQTRIEATTRPHTARPIEQHEPTVITRPSPPPRAYIAGHSRSHHPDSQQRRGPGVRFTKIDRLGPLALRPLPPSLPNAAPLLRRAEGFWFPN